MLPQVPSHRVPFLWTLAYTQLAAAYTPLVCGIIVFHRRNIVLRVLDHDRDGPQFHLQPPAIKLAAMQASHSLSSRRTVPPAAPPGLQPPAAEQTQALSLHHPAPQGEERYLRHSAVEDVEIMAEQAPHTLSSRRLAPQAVLSGNEQWLQPSAAKHALGPNVDLEQTLLAPSLSSRRTAGQSTSQNPEWRPQPSAASVEHAEPRAWLTQPLSAVPSRCSISAAAPQNRSRDLPPTAVEDAGYAIGQALLSSPSSSSRLPAPLAVVHVPTHRFPPSTMTSAMPEQARADHQAGDAAGVELPRAVFVPDMPKQPPKPRPVPRPQLTLNTQPVDINGQLQHGVQDFLGIFQAPAPGTVQDGLDATGYRTQITPVLTAFLGNVTEQTDMVGANKPRRSARPKKTSSEVDVPSAGKKVSAKKAPGTKKRAT